VFGGTRMTGRTKLYQKSGSPLIEGDSKIVRPFWSVWLSGVVLGFVIAVVVVILLQWFVLDPGTPLSFGDVVVGSVVWVAMFGSIGLLLGSAFGTWLAHNMGWHRTSLGAGIVGALLALASIYVLLYALGQSLTAPG